MRLALLAAACLAGGCGTVASLCQPDDAGRVYGGVRKDLAWATQLVEGPPDPNGPLKGGDSGAALLGAFLIVAPVLDFPLSLVGDTLTLPLARLLDADK